jgi:hypothetical protein
MSETVDALLSDLLKWLAKGEQPYHDVMEAWRTSCPRLPVWEEANERGFVARHQVGGALTVGITPAGRDFLARRTEGTEWEGERAMHSHISRSRRMRLTASSAG